MIFDRDKSFRAVAILEGGEFCDARGKVRFVNTFNFKGVERFYTLCPAELGLVRGWTGHKVEAKWFHVICGTMLLGVVQPDSWSRPSRELPVLRYSLSADSPRILAVPAGFATASVALSPGAMLMVFSTGSLEGAASDDYRFPSDMWQLLA